MIRVFNNETDDLLFVMPDGVVPAKGCTIDVEAKPFIVEEVVYVARRRRDIAVSTTNDQVYSIGQIDIYVKELVL